MDVLASAPLMNHNPPASAPQPRSPLRAACLLFALVLVAGCGGGGGSAPAPAPAPPPPASVTISGVAEFESVPNTAGGRLDYAARALRPIRGATVELIATTGAALASTRTDGAGQYSFTVANPNAEVLVRVRAELRRSGASGGSWDFSVRDNTSSEALWVVDSARFTPAAAQTQNLRAASGWNGSSYTVGARAAAPFAILDVAYRATQKVLSASPNLSFPALQVMWSPGNVPAVGSSEQEWAQGQIGTSFFTDYGGRRRLFLLGAADTDTDEYDSHVVAHEWGHYFQHALSRNDSVGGEHRAGDQLDMGVAFSEGWGNAWSGMALASPLYADSLGPGQASGFVIDVSLAPGSNRGWFSEASVHYLLWRFDQDPGIGFGPIFSVMNGPLRTASTMASIHSFAAALKSALPAAVGTIDSLLQSQIITVANAVGSTEVNNGGVSQALPIYRSYAGGTLQTCVTDSAGVPNKLGNFSYIRFTTMAGARTLTLSAVPGTSGTDPDFVLTRADGTQANFDSDLTNIESTVTTLPAGTHTLALSDYNMRVAPSPIGQRCFNFSVQ